MIVRRSIPLRWALFYVWKPVVALTLVSLAVVVYDDLVGHDLRIDTLPVSVLGTALAIYLGFRSNNAYERWWEARKIWGLLVNYSRAWTRQVDTMITAPMGGNEDARKAAEDCRGELLDRHVAFVHGLRIHLRNMKSVAHETTDELYTAKNSIQEISRYLAPSEFTKVSEADNPPNLLLHTQGRRLASAAQQGWLSDYRWVQLDQTLVEFNNIQGRAERIKATAFPRAYSAAQRMLVFVHGSLLPFALLDVAGWLTIPLAVTINFVFLVLDYVSSRTEDPFENRMDDTPMTGLSRNIEINVREATGTGHLPAKVDTVDGVMF